MKKSVSESKLRNTTDASVWAKEYVRVHGGDEGLLITWFASTIMTGYDTGRRAEEKLRLSIQGNSRTSEPASNLKIKVIPLADLTPYPRNPRHITPAAVNAVAESLQQFGFQQPIVIDPKRVIVAGHTRCLAALQLGWTHAPTVQIAAKHAKAYRLADNRSGEFSTWNLDLLGSELEALPSGLLEALPALDFDAIVQQPVEGQTDPDDIPEAPTPRTKLGDVWTLGDHRLMCGDATNPACVHSLLNSATPALMVTDPPYGVSYDAAWRVGSTLPNTRQGTASGKVANDECHNWLGAYRLHPGNVAYVWMASQNLGAAQQDLLKANFEARALLIWNKSSITPGRGHYQWKHEPCWYAVRKGERAEWLGDRSQPTVWDIPKPHKSETGHSTQKPVECMQRPIRNHKGDVYDPFLGSGTTIIAAEREKRRCYAMEIAPEYVDIAVARWEAFTGCTAIAVE